jgi:hypothetical protein
MRGIGGIAPRILDFSNGWRWVVSFTPRPLYPRERSLCTHWIEVWVGARAGLDTVVKRKIPSPCRKTNPQSSVRVSALYHWATRLLKLSLCLNKHHTMKTYLLFNNAPSHKTYWGSGGIVPPIRKLSTRWRRVVSLTPRPLRPLYLLYRRLGGTQIQSGRSGTDKKFHYCSCCETNPVRHTSGLVAILCQPL